MLGETRAKQRPHFLCVPWLSPVVGNPDSDRTSKLARPSEGRTQLRCQSRTENKTAVRQSGCPAGGWRRGWRRGWGRALLTWVCRVQRIFHLPPLTCSPDFQFLSVKQEDACWASQGRLGAHQDKGQTPDLPFPSCVPPAIELGGSEPRLCNYNISGDITWE